LHATEITGSAHAGQRLVRDLASLVLLAILATAARYLVYRLAIGDGSLSDYITKICDWDCHWYRGVAYGYDVFPAAGRAGDANWVFFPLFPLLTRLVQMVTGLDWAHAGFVFSNLCGIAAALICRPLLRSERAYWLFAVGLIAGPFSLHFSLPYSEALFILLTLLALRALERSRYVTAGGWGALLSATRVTGVLIGFALVVQAVVDKRRSGLAWAELPRALLTDRRLLLGALLVPIGLIAFMVYLRFHTGDGLAFAHAQIGWSRSVGNPIAKWWATMLTGWPFRDGFGTQTTLGWTAMTAMGLTIALAATGRWAAAVFCAVALLVSMSAGLTSIIRFSTGLAPLGLVLAGAFAFRGWTAVLGHVLGIGAGLVITAAWLLRWNLLV
jgi:hypothetical protein